MYHAITDPRQRKNLKEARTFCSALLDELKHVLNEEYGINVEIRLIGSVGKRLIVQNGNNPIDIDYNVNILNYDWLEMNDRQVKETIRKTLDEVLHDNKLKKVKDMGYVDDSTSALESPQIPLETNPAYKFSFDVGIVRQDEHGWHRLVHKKTDRTGHTDTYSFELLPNSAETFERYDEIVHVDGGYDLLLDNYIKVKNRYLTSKNTNDEKTHPSFICFIEAVNNVYNHLRQIHVLP